MFDLITGKEKHLAGGGGTPVLVSSALHVLVLGLIVVIPLLYVTDSLPDVPDTMMAFVAAAPPPPPPPPPPPAPARAQEPVKAVAASPNAAPVEAPPAITPEPAATAGLDEGMPGGIEGGIPGGVIGGIVGGLPEAPPPPPPPPPPAPRGPVRVGGNIKQPTLLHRVEPIYPEIAVKAQVGGTVILEAIVDENGEVQNVKVLRSVPLLDKSAITAVSQWRYSPVILNDKPVPFVLTVVLSFTIPPNASGRY